VELPSANNNKDESIDDLQLLNEVNKKIHLQHLNNKAIAIGLIFFSGTQFESNKFIPTMPLLPGK